MTDNEWETTSFPQYTDQQEAEIIRRSPIVDVARDLGITVADRGDGNFTGVCPWCQPSDFVIYSDEGNWICYGCSESGRDVLILVCKVRELWRADAIQWLEQRLNRQASQ
ncbi:CHC2 zinc finger domain-containing protein [Streptosporangium roseum]|uniref:CHC2 zinc finger domain-containing protein n=1 Tax=Streptosporangium roseum TaxID=2001 RepID=UPI003327933D